MLYDILKELASELSFVLYGISGAIASAVSLAIALIAFKKYKIAMFLQDPDSSDGFKNFYILNASEYGSKEDAAKDYLNKVQLAHQYEYLYGRKERARQLYNDRKDAYRYLKSIDKMNYRGFDDSLNDEGFEYYLNDFDNNKVQSWY